MKKTFTLLSSALLMFSAFSGKAQTIMSENFDAALTLPAGWAQYNVDGLTVNGGVSFMGTNAWTVRAATGGNIITSTSWYTPAAASNDWLVTPAITIPAGPASLKYDIQAQDAAFPDGYQVYVSSTGNTVADFAAAAIYTEAAAPSTYTTRFVDLAAFAGSTVYIAFRNTSNDMFLLNLDNISVFVPLQTDMGAISITLPNFTTNGTNVTIAGKMQNFGSDPVTSFTLNYSVDAGTPVTQNITGVNLAALSGTYNFSASTPWVAGPVGTHTIKAWATNINGNADLNTTNDEISGTVLVASQTVPRITCIEEFTSSTCVPCASFNVGFDPILEQNNANNSTGPGSSVVAVKYQMDWPAPGTDPSYNAHGVARQNFYGVSGIPSPWIDGKEMATGGQSDIDAALTIQSPMSISMTYSVSGSLVTATATVTPYINVSAGAKLYIALTEKQYVYSGTTTQTEFHHAMRRMLPDGGGITLTNLVDGVAQTFTQTYTTNTAVAPVIPAQNSFTLWTGGSNIEMVAFVQDVASQEIYNAAIGTLVAGVEDNQTSFGVNVYPNPANDLLAIVLNLKQSSKVTTEVLNSLGQVVYSANQGQVSGVRNLQINTSEFANGIYFVRINANGNLKTMKFSVAH